MGGSARNKAGLARQAVAAAGDCKGLKARLLNRLPEPDPIGLMPTRWGAGL